MWDVICALALIRAASGLPNYWPVLKSVSCSGCKSMTFSLGKGGGMGGRHEDVGLMLFLGRAYWNAALLERPPFGPLLNKTPMPFERCRSKALSGLER